MTIEYKKSYGLCDKHDQKITIKIKFFIDETLYVRTRKIFDSVFGG